MVQKQLEEINNNNDPFIPCDHKGAYYNIEGWHCHKCGEGRPHQQCIDASEFMKVK